MPAAPIILATFLLIGSLFLLFPPADAAPEAQRAPHIHVHDHGPLA